MPKRGRRSRTRRRWPGNGAVGVVAEARMTGRFLAGLPSFLRARVTDDEAARTIRGHLAGRTASFLDMLRRAVFDQPSSPYRALFDHAGIEFADVERLVERDGLEGTLGALHGAGVYLTLDEFKGRAPVRRGSATWAVTPGAFDNTISAGHFSARSGGSRSRGTRLVVDLGMLRQESCYDTVTFRDFDLDGRPRAMWRPAPPGSAGVKIALRLAHIGRPLDRWFTQNPIGSAREWRHWLFTTSTAAASRAAGVPLPLPQHVPISRADIVALWLAECVTRGRPALLETNSASAVRICGAARERGLDISGTFFRVGGEPYSRGKASAIAAAGCRAATHYSMSEVGRIGNACADPAALDDVHVAIDKVALLSRDLTIGGAQVAGLFLTALTSTTPRIMVNVELGDYALRRDRRCGCTWSRLGFTEHLEQIRSYEKLTAEGMHFVGADLITLVEEILPARFGGDASAYQFLEEEDHGVPRVSLVVSPRVGPIDASRATEVVLSELSARGAAHRLMAARWLESGTLRLVRREPEATFAGKILALHVPRSAAVAGDGRS